MQVLLRPMYRLKFSRLRPSGLALGTVLLCFLALTIILFAAATGSVSHLRVVSAAEDQEHARNLAESVISTAMEQIAQTNAQPANLTVSIEGVEGEGTLTFDSSLEPRAYSSFNLEGDAAIDGTRNIVVPANTVHLVGKGKVGSAQSIIECIYYKPPFPDALLASGPVKASALKLYGIRQGDSYAGGPPENIDPEDELPGNLFSNFEQGWTTGESTASISENSDISGSLGAVGTVAVDASSVVGGELIAASRSRPIPNIDILEKINALKPNAIPYSSSTLDENWYVISTGDLNVPGDLDLNGSALLVEGDLTVTGAVSGTGVIFVAGDVTINDGGSAVIAGEQTAIACTGNFNLRANDPEGNYFKGLVYCEGEFLARDITVVGATVVNAQDNAVARGQAELENVRFVHEAGSVSLFGRRPQGFEIKSNHFCAFSFITRQQADGQGMVCDVKAYFSDAAGVKPGSLDEPGDWQALGGSLDHFEVWSMQGIAVGGPDRNAILQNLYPALREFLIESIELGLTNNDWLAQDEALFKEWLVERFFLEPSTDEYSLGFSLNNLLGDLLGSSRVLLWRSLAD